MKLKKPTLQRYTTKKPTLQRYTTQKPTLQQCTTKKPTLQTVHHEKAYTRICTADDITRFNYLLIMCLLFDIYFILLFTLCLLFSQGHLKKFKGKLMFRQIAQLLTGPHASNDRHIFTFKYM